jgi:hypothetical protein
MSRRPYAHAAVLDLDPTGDDSAPGAAITMALCGSWSHEPPCPLAPHHTDATRSGSTVALRILFAAEPADEVEVRRRIDEALARGQGADPAGAHTSWQLIRSGPSDVRPGELAHARRLTES